ncbi:thioredoxin family protein [bacterium]|nr:thioredoxin family protein [bacterium]
MNRKHTVTLLLSLLVALTLPGIAFAEIEVGEMAPQFTAVDSNGNEHNLKDFRGKNVVLEWTNPRCPYVVKHYDTKNMQSLQKKYTDKGVIWLTINSSAEGKQGNLSAEEANRSIAESGSAQTAYLLDPEGKIGKMYGARTTPHMYVIDGEGTLVYAGAIDNNSSSRHTTVANAKNYVAEALDAIMMNKPVEVAATNAYGCSVKYKS